MSSSYDITANIEAVDKASKVFDRVGKKAGGLGKTFGRLGDIVTVAGGFMVAQVGVRAAGAVEDFVSGSIDSFSDFESGIAKIVAATGTVGDEATVLRNRFSEVSQAAALEFGVSASQAAGALESLVKAGLDGEAALMALNSAVQMSVVEQISSEEASNLLVSTLAQFRLGADSATRAVDALTNASRLGIGSASEYAGGLSYVGTAASNLGFSLEETLSALVLVDATQKDAVKSGRLLNRMFSDMITHQDDLGFSLYDSRGNMLSLDEIVNRLTLTMDGFGTQAERDAYLNEVFGEQGKRAALALLGQSDALVDLTGKMGEAGSAQEMFSTQMGTHAGKMARAQAAVESMQMALGEALAPALEMAADVLVENREELKMVMEALGVLIKDGLWVAVAALKGFYVIGKTVWDLLINLGRTIMDLGARLQQVYDAYVRPVVDAIQGTISQIKEAFDWLADQLVGHSVWTDMFREMDRQTKEWLPQIESRFEDFTPKVLAEVDYAKRFTEAAERLPSATGGVNSSVNINSPLIVVEGSADRATAELASRLVVEELRRMRR